MTRRDALQRYSSLLNDLLFQPSIPSEERLRALGLEVHAGGGTATRALEKYRRTILIRLGRGEAGRGLEATFPRTFAALGARGFSPRTVLRAFVATREFESCLTIVSSEASITLEEAFSIWVSREHELALDLVKCCRSEAAYFLAAAWNLEPDPSFRITSFLTRRLQKIAVIVDSVSGGELNHCYIAFNGAVVHTSAPAEVIRFMLSDELSESRLISIFGKLRNFRDEEDVRNE